MVVRPRGDWHSRVGVVAIVERDPPPPSCRYAQLPHRREDRGVGEIQRLRHVEAKRAASPAIREQDERVPFATER